MPVIKQINHWRASTALGGAYERLLSSLGTESFGPTVRDSVKSMTAGVRRIYLFEANSPEQNSLQYFSCEPGFVNLFPAYLKWYLPIDPVSDAYRATSERNSVAIQRIRPADIESPGFRRRVFEDPGIVERLSIVQRGTDAWRVINVARHVSAGRFSDREINSLIGLASLVLPMLPLNRERTTNRPDLTVTQLEQRFAERFGNLTGRERQVCARAAIGMSVEATALDLGIAKTSVLTYRQRAYQRLRITSPYELCSLVTY